MDRERVIDLGLTTSHCPYVYGPVYEKSVTLVDGNSKSVVSDFISKGFCPLKPKSE